MAYPKLPEWPIIDPDRPPEGYIKVAHHEDRDRNSIPWDFFVTDGYLLLVSKEWIQYGGKPGRFITEQYEYPIEVARWFVTTISRFFLEPGHPNAVPRGEITIEEKVGGEILGVTRGAQYGNIPKAIPGYSLDNLNRFEHTSLGPDDNWCQMFKMGDPWLFEHGLLDVFKDIAERHERGEF